MFLNTNKPVVWLAVAPLGQHVSYSGSVLEQIVLLLVYVLPGTLRAGGQRVATFCLPHCYFLPHSGVSWYLRKCNQCQESNACQGLHGVGYLG